MTAANRHSSPLVARPSRRRPPEPAHPVDERPYASRRGLDDGTLWLSGSVDEAAAPVLRAELLQAVSERPPLLVVDLTDVDFFPSRAVGALVAGLVAAERQGVATAVRVRSGSVPHRVLHVCCVPYLVD